MMLTKVLRMIGIVVVVLLFAAPPASAGEHDIEYQFLPDMNTPQSQGWDVDATGGGTGTIGPEALIITDVNTTAPGIIYFATHSTSTSTQPWAFECRAVVKITDYNDASERALFFLEYVTGRNTYGRNIRAGIARTADGRIKAGFVGEDGEWVTSGLGAPFYTSPTYTTPQPETGFVELVMKKEVYATTGTVYLYLNGVIGGVIVSNVSDEFQYIGSTATQQFRFGTIGLPATGTVEVLGASCANYDNYCIAPAIITPCVSPPPGDVNGDCQVDMLDLDIMVSEWTNSNNF